MVLLSGKEFNKKYKNKKFYRLNNENENHGFMDKNDEYIGYQYKTGLNIDTIPFNPIGICSKGKPTAGGLNFTDIIHIGTWYSPNKKWIRQVIIPDDARVYVYENHYKADKIILSKRIDIKDFYVPSKYCLRCIQEHECAQSFIRDEDVTLEIKNIIDEYDEWMLFFINYDTMTSDEWCSYFYDSQ